MTGEKVRSALLSVISSHESVREAVTETLEGRPSPGFTEPALMAARNAVREALGIFSDPKHSKPGLQPDIFEAYCEKSGDPDTPLAEWLRSGAPMGASRSVTRVGIFPPDIKHHRTPESHLRTRSITGWDNYRSAEQAQRSSSPC